MEHEITLISGYPHHGKSILLSRYKDYFPSINKFHLDAFFSEYNTIENIENFDIGTLLTTKKFNKFLFLYIFKKNIIDNCFLNNKNPFIEIACSGFILNFISDDIIKLFNEYKLTNITNYDMKEYSFIYDNENFAFGDFNKKTIDEDVIIKTFKKLQQHEYNKIKHKITYQTFEEFDSFKSSDSKKKLENCDYDSIDLKNKSFLDIGCNTGYFCFKIAEKTNSLIIGIDNNEETINTANQLNRKVFKKHNIEFKTENIFNYVTEKKFDVIQCLSAYHYFSDVNKIKLFNIVFNLLNNNGIFILEVEENPDNQLGLLLEKERPAGGKLSYPNEKWIKEQLNNKFDIVKKNKSVFQAGSIFDRYIYQLKKL